MTRDEAIALLGKHVTAAGMEYQPRCWGPAIAAILEAAQIGRRSMQEEAAKILERQSDRRAATAVRDIKP